MSDQKRITDLYAQIKREEQELAERHEGLVTNLINWFGLQEGKELQFRYTRPDHPSQGVPVTKTVAEVYLNQTGLNIVFKDLHIVDLNSIEII
jgi:hypothetical protein